MNTNSDPAIDYGSRSLNGSIYNRKTREDDQEDCSTIQHNINNKINVLEDVASI